MHVIDFRNRPNTRDYRNLLMAPPGRYMLEQVLRHPVPEEQTEDQWIDEIKKVGFDKVVFTGRDNETRAGWKLSNDHLADVCSRFPDCVIGVAGIDPLKKRKALEELERSVKQLGLKGASIDPFSIEMYANDRKLYPLYEKCDELGVPIFITMGPLPVLGTYLKYASMLPIDDVATDFPNLNIVVSHAAWPYTNEIIAIAWRHTNVYLETSVYLWNPGAEAIVEAANTIISDRVLFATAWPFAPMEDSLERFIKLPFAPDVLPKLLYDNAASLLKL